MLSLSRLTRCCVSIPHCIFSFGGQQVVVTARLQELTQGVAPARIYANGPLKADRAEPYYWRFVITSCLI